MESITRKRVVRQSSCQSISVLKDHIDREVKNDLHLLPVSAPACRSHRRRCSMALGITAEAPLLCPFRQLACSAPDSTQLTETDHPASILCARAAVNDPSVSSHLTVEAVWLAKCRRTICKSNNSPVSLIATPSARIRVRWVAHRLASPLRTRDLHDPYPIPCTQQLI